MNANDYRAQWFSCALHDEREDGHALTQLNKLRQHVMRQRLTHSSVTKSK